MSRPLPSNQSKPVVAARVSKRVLYNTSAFGTPIRDPGNSSLSALAHSMHRSNSGSPSKTKRSYKRPGQQHAPAKSFNVPPFCVSSAITKPASRRRLDSMIATRDPTNERQARQFPERPRAPTPSSAARTLRHRRAHKGSPQPQTHTVPVWCVPQAFQHPYPHRTGHAKIPLQKWVVAMYLQTSSLTGASSMKLHRALEITQEPA